VLDSSHTRYLQLSASIHCEYPPHVLACSLLNALLCQSRHISYCSMLFSSPQSNSDNSQRARFLRTYGVQVL
jgi:hypothetical protein